MKLTNHISNPGQIKGRTYNALHPELSIKEDYRRGSYYIKHIHQIDTMLKLYMVFKDNADPQHNKRGNATLYMCAEGSTVAHTAEEALQDCINWIDHRRCFKTK